MSFFLHLGLHALGLRTKQRNRGTCLVWKCPKCDKLTDFSLIESRSSFDLLGQQLSAATELLDFRCTVCGYEIRVAPSEKDLLDQLRLLTAQLKAGSITPEAYKDSVQRLPARFARDLAALTETRKCPTCGEDNPVNFHSCWRCQTTW